MTRGAASDGSPFFICGFDQRAAAPANEAAAGKKRMGGQGLTIGQRPPVKQAWLG